MNLVRRSIHQIYLYTLKKDQTAFLKACKSVKETQERILKNIINQNSESAFGKKYQFSSIRSVDDFRHSVPIHSYDDIEPWIRRGFEGEEKILTSEPVLIYEVTSGTTSKNKYIPFTGTYLREIQSAINAWIGKTYSEKPQMIGTRSYWSLSPVMRKAARSPGGTPIGMENDLEYLSGWMKYLTSLFQAVAPDVAHIQNLTEWRHRTCLDLLKCADLGFISVWSPTFLTELMREIESGLPNYLSQLSLARRVQIESQLKNNDMKLGEKLWNQLGVVSCWADGMSKQFMPELSRWFPKSMIQSKGLFATEGAVSIPWPGINGNPLAITSHFLEFIDIESSSQSVVAAHELVPQKKYSPLLTTGSGLYRYHLKDIVECVGYFQDVPTIQFIGKLEQTSDMCGEKLTAVQVQEAIEAAFPNRGESSNWFLLVPNQKMKKYFLFMEPVADREVDAEAFDQNLRKNVHYDLCRKLGQLLPVEVVKVMNGESCWREELVRRRVRLGDIKPSFLSQDPSWLDFFKTKIEGG